MKMGAYALLIGVAALSGVVLAQLQITERVIGGKSAPPETAPYQVSLRQVNQHFCGGAIIGDRWVLTAAHCVDGQRASSIQIVVGTNKLNSGGQVYRAHRLIAHEGYNRRTIRHDIALIETTSKFNWSDSVQKIALPKSDTGRGRVLTLTGWGLTQYPSNSQPNNLQIIQLNAISNSECQLRHRYTNTVYSSQICTLNEKGEGVCSGDSGGPLTNGDEVVGVVSWGIACARGYPDVFTRVFSYKNWITAKTNSQVS